MITLTDWQLKQRDPQQPIARDFEAAEGWIAATVPGTVHQDLLAANVIPDPYWGMNEKQVQWVGEVDWLYRTTFTVTEAMLQASHLTLVFGGLDTFATVWLNGEHILTSDNMFRTHRLSIRDRVRLGENRLDILFESALRCGRAIEAQYGKRPAWGDGDSSRLYVRKAQYHYGWDWGPTLLTAGVWRAAAIEAYDARIAEIDCPVEVAPDLGAATFPVSVVVEGRAESISIALLAPDGTPLAQVDKMLENAAVTHTFTVERPQLWYPNGYGAQPLYTLRVTLDQDGEAIATRTQRQGVRRLELVQEPLLNAPGTSFLFQINNTPVFCGGANWIPADSFTPRITPDDYRDWLHLAVNAHMNMLRVWGGGIYEEDVFFDLCDEMGLMVWQDFMFACGLYPAPEWLINSVRAEAEDNVKRLRHHPALVLWCGNNEDYQVAESCQVFPSANGTDDPRFPARRIYEHLLPEICARLDSTRPYRPGSPYGGVQTSNDPTVGDRHTWDVWHGFPMPGDYHDYHKFGARFISEFGMIAYPERALIDTFTDPAERYPQSRTIEFHIKAGGGVERIALYLAVNIPMPNTLDDYIYGTQFIQAEALTNAFRDWRRAWGGPGQYATAGALVWQLNDCWPVVSWAIADRQRTPKPAYYAIRRLLAPIVVGLAPTECGAEVWIVNGRTREERIELELRLFTLDGDLLAEEQQPITLSPNQTTELPRFSFDPSQPVVLAARILQDGEVIARAALWPEPFKYYALPDPEISIDAQDGSAIRLSVKRPAKGVVATQTPGLWSDNMLDLFPGDPQTISAPGLDAATVSVRCLNGRTNA
jgi:beta-mannosidase